jgi:membrane protease YdiL (CAAX protease family)
LASLFFVIPMLAAYEGGVLLLGAQATRNGADVWLRRSLDHLGFGQYFLLPALTCGLLLAWHHTRRDDWRINWSTCYGMLAESAVFGAVLLTIAQVQGSFFTASLPEAKIGWVNFTPLGKMIGYLGAGIYEELLFRLMLLPVAIVVLKSIGLPRKWSVGIAAVATGALFAAAHYQFDFTLFGMQFASRYGDTFDWFSFSFRSLAGVFFSLLFVIRGFGITAGSHALYDILVVAL